ncbi:MAG: DUF547 domain-containing protein [Myxococcales bacterium]|nr:DUF547 domain-containing protein [Myxococcales bacterium]
MIVLLAPLALVAAHADDDSGFDHSHARLATFLSGAVSAKGVDYGTLASRRSTLDAYVTQIREARTDGWSNAQKLALWVNAYNAYTLQLMLDNGPPSSIMNLDGGKVWDTRRFQVAGASVTLNDLEHQRARKIADGRVHAVVNCASKGCPPLPPSPLTPQGQSGQMDRATRTWAATNAFTLQGDTILLSKIFDWYGDDFTKENKGDIAGVEGKAENALWFLSRFVDAPTKSKLLSGTLSVDWQDYDWALNAR